MYICWQLVSPGAMRLIGVLLVKKNIGEQGKLNLMKTNRYSRAFSLYGRISVLKILEKK